MIKAFKINGCLFEEVSVITKRDRDIDRERLREKEEDKDFFLFKSQCVALLLRTN